MPLVGSLGGLHIVLLIRARSENESSLLFFLSPPIVSGVLSASKHKLVMPDRYARGTSVFVIST